MIDRAGCGPSALGSGTNGISLLRYLISGRTIRPACTILERKDMNKHEDDDDICQKPCPPENPCEECAAYWERMKSEGYWDAQRHEWTAAGMREMLK